MKNPDVSRELVRIQNMSPADKVDTRSKVSTKIRKLLQELEKKRLEPGR